MPVPAPHSSHLARSAGAASASVGNNVMGNETLRPSNSSTVSSLLVTFTALILWCKRLIPLCAQFGVVLLNDVPDGSPLRGAETRRMSAAAARQPQLTAAAAFRASLSRRPLAHRPLRAGARAASGPCFAAFTCCVPNVSAATQRDAIARAEGHRDARGLLSPCGLIWWKILGVAATAGRTFRPRQTQHPAKPGNKRGDRVAGRRNRRRA